MRQIDDKIVYAINQSIPTASFKGQSDAKENCKGLHETVSSRSEIFTWWTLFNLSSTLLTMFT